VSDPIECPKCQYPSPMCDDHREEAIRLLTEIGVWKPVLSSHTRPEKKEDN